MGTKEKVKKERKANWKEVYATVDDIKAFLGDRLFLRHNVITGRVEYREPSIYPPNLGGEGRSEQAHFGDGYMPVNDRLVNSLWAEMSKQKPVRVQDIYRVIESDFVADYHPFRFYLDRLPPWNGEDHILAMSMSVQVKGGVDEQLRFAEYLKKWLVTMPAIDERAAYAHFHEHRQHIASFCGTGNNPQFLTDPTGNRRWLPFRIDSIMSPRDNPFDYVGIYSQAYALYRQGFRYWFSQGEIEQLTAHNRSFEIPHLESELVHLYFRKPMGVESGIFMSVARAMQIISANISQKLNAVYLGRAFVEQGYQRVKSNGQRGYIVELRTGEEIQRLQRQMADEGDVDSGQ